MDPKISSFIIVMEDTILKTNIKKIEILIIKTHTIIMILMLIKYHCLNKLTMNILLGILI